MSEQKHTAGPWKVTWPGPVPYIHCPADGVFVAALFTVREETHANARLIAAAPELLELARQYASECAECGGRGFTYGDDGVSGRGPDDVEPTRHECPDCADIRAVIAKAN